MPGEVGLCPLSGPVPIPICPLPCSRLTAFVLKVLSLAQEQVGGSPEKLQETIRWLLTQQQADGSFRDSCPVIHRGMQGGLVGNDETVALTAFVVIALHHGLAVFQDKNTEQLKQSVVSAPACLPFSSPQVSPFLLRNPGVLLPDLLLHFPLGNVHLKC